MTEKRAAPTCGSSGGAYFCIARDPLVDYAAPLAFVVLFDDQGQPHVQGTFYPSLEIWRYDDDAHLVFSHDARFNPLGFLHLYQFGPLANQARYQ